MSRFLEFLGRVGSGLGAAGRDITGQMFGRLGPNDSSTFGGRMANIAANNANPMGLMQTGQAFLDGFRGEPVARNLSGAAGRVSDAAAQRVNTGSVVGRGFIGRAGLGPTAATGLRNPNPRNALGYQLGQAPGVPTPGNWSVATAGRGTGALMTGPTQAEIDAMAAEQGGFPAAGGSGGGGGGVGAGGGGNSARHRAALHGASQLGQASADVLANQEARFRARGGLMQER